MSTLENAAAVLKLFACATAATHRRELSFSEIANRLALPKSTLSRLLASMEHQGLLMRNPANRLYSVGDLLLAVGRQSQAHPLKDVITPAMSNLTRVQGCAGFVCLLEQDYIRIVDIANGCPERPVSYSVGHRLPAAQTAVGRVLLAGYSEREVIERLAPGAATHAALPHPGLSHLLQQLAVVRRQGWSYGRNETRPDQSALATSLIHPARNEQVGLCLTFPTLNNRHEFPHQLLCQLKSTTRLLAEKIGDQCWRF